MLNRAGAWVLWATAAAPLLFSSRTIFPYVVPRTVYFRILVAIAVLVAASLCAADRSRRAGVAVRLRRDPVLFALCVFTAIQVLAGALGAAPEHSLFGDLQRMGGAIAWIHYLAFYVAMRVILGEHEMVALLRVAMLGSIAVGVIAVLQAGGVEVGILPGTGASRVVGTLGNAGFLAAYGLLGIAVAAVVGATAGARVWKALSGAAVAVNLLAMTVAFTRTALIGLGAGLVVGLLVYAASSDGRGRRWSYAGIGAVLVFAVLGVWGVTAGVGGDSRVGRLFDRANLGRGFGNRVSAWRAGVLTVADHPATGIGPENFRLAFDWHFEPERLPAASHFNRAHNELLEATVGGGIPGGLAWLAIWLALVYALFDARRARALSAGETAVLAATFTAYFVYLQAWFADPNSLLLFVMLAAFVGTRRAGSLIAESAPDGGPQGLTFGKALVVGVATLLAGVDIVYQARLFAGGEHLVQALQERRVAATAAEYQAALDLRLPGAEEVVTELVRFSTALPGAVGDQLADPQAKQLVLDVLDRARAALESHVAGDRRNPRLHRDAGQLHVVRYQVSGDTAFADSAVASFERAIDLAPGRIQYRNMLSETELMVGRPAAAVRAVEDGISAHDGFGESYYYLAKALLVQGSYLEAADALVRGYELHYMNRSGAVHNVLERRLREAGELEAILRLEDARSGARANRQGGESGENDPEL